MESRRFSQFLPIPVLFLSLATLAGLFLGILEISRNRYWNLGFYRTSALILQERLLETALAGLAFAVGAILFGMVARRYFPRSWALFQLARWARVLRGGGYPAWITACILLLPFLWFGSSTLTELLRKETSDPLKSRILLALLVYSALLLLLARLLPHLVKVQTDQFLVSSYVSMIVFLTSAFVIRRVETGSQFGWDQALLAAVISGMVLSLVLVWFAGRRSRACFLVSCSPVLALPAILAISILFASFPRSVANPHNVILIGIDTLRADHTSLHREDERAGFLTPSLLELSRRSATFPEAISQAPWTMPAFASILTGLYPKDHGAQSLFGLLAPEQVTLAELLRESGYRTLGIVSHDYVAEDYGFGQGFESFDSSLALGHWAVTSADITNRAIQLLDGRDGSPFFLFLHYFDPHYEFIDHPGWAFADAYKGWLKDEPFGITHLRHQRQFLREPDIRYLQDLYDEEIAFTDQQIGRLLSHLRSSGLEDGTAVIVVADHGEEFLERGWLGHTITLHEEVIRVPMVLYLPGVTGNRKDVETPVETRAVFATVLDYLGIPWFDPGQPESLLGLIMESEAGEPAEEKPLFSSVWLPNEPLETGKRSMMSAIRLGEWKLIVDATHRRELLYNLKNDPGETRNVLSEAKEKHLELLALHSRWLAQQADKPELRRRNLSPEEIQKLKALGYL